VKIKDFYPRDVQSLDSGFDFNMLAIQITFAFQNLFISEEREKKVKRNMFTLLLKRFNRRAVVFIDSISDQKGEKGEYVFMVVFLFPEFISELELEKYKKIIYEVGTEYYDSQESYLKKGFLKIKDILSLEEKVKDSEIVLNEDYSFNNALHDFKKGAELFSNNKFEQAFFFIKKALLRFEFNNNIKLIVESYFFLGSALLKLKKYREAQSYFKKLINLSKEINHQKYNELAIFLNGYCAFKIEDYTGALKEFRKLESSELHNVNKFNYYFLYGRVLRLLQLNSNAILFLKKAVDIESQFKNQGKFIKKKAKLYTELGNSIYKMALNIVIAGKINPELFTSYLRDTLYYYNNAIMNFKELNDYYSLIRLLILVGNIYDLLNEDSKSIESYRNSLRFAEISNDIFNRLRSYNLIIQTLAKHEKYESLIKEIDQILSEILPYAFIDLITISNYHKNSDNASLNLPRLYNAYPSSLW
jgi:tetratricopeptide (TPR) repeat protein